MSKIIHALVVLSFTNIAEADTTLHAGIEVSGGRHRSEQRLYGARSQSQAMRASPSAVVGLSVPLRMLPRISLGPELRFTSWRLVADDRAYESQMIELGVTPCAVLVETKRLALHASTPFGLTVSRLGGEASEQLFVPTVGLGFNVGVMLGATLHVGPVVVLLDGGYRMSSADHDNQSAFSGFLSGGRYRFWLHQAVGRLSVGVRL